MEGLRELIQASPFRTQEKFSEAVGIDEIRVSKLCRGIVDPTEEELKKIKMALNPPPMIFSIEKIRKELSSQRFPLSRGEQYQLTVLFSIHDVLADIRNHLIKERD